MSKQLIQWWTLVCLEMVGVGALFATEVDRMIAHSDRTFICAAIFVLHLVGTVKVGQYLFADNSENAWRRRYQQRCVRVNTVDLTWTRRFVDIMAQLGIVGTVVGLIMVMRAVSGNVSADPSALKSMMETLTSGIGTSLWTTLFGIVGGLSLYVQLGICDGPEEN